MTAFMPSSSFNSIFSPDAYEPSPSLGSSFFSLAPSSGSPYHSSPSTTEPDFSAFFFPSITSIAEQLRAASAPTNFSSSPTSSPSSSSASALSLPPPLSERSPTQEEIDFLAAFGSRPLDEADELFLDSGYTVNDPPLPYTPEIPAGFPLTSSSSGPTTVPFDSLGSACDLFAPDLLKSSSAASHATSSAVTADLEEFDFFTSSELLGGSLDTYDPFSLGVMVQEGGEDEPSWLQDAVKEDESCGIEGWSEEEQTETVKIVVEDGEECVLEGWSGEEVYSPSTMNYLPLSSHASTSTNDTYLLPVSPPPVISSLQPPRVPHRARSNPSLATSESPSSTSSYRRKLLPAKPSLPVLRENFRQIKEEQTEDFSAQFATVGGYGGHSLGMGQEWEGRTTGSELYGGFQSMQDVSRRFTSDYPHVQSKPNYPPSTPAYHDPLQFAQPPPLHVYTVQTTARLQAYSPTPPSPPPLHASPLTFSPTIVPSCIDPAPIPSRRSANLVQEDKDASTSRRSQSLTSPPPTPVLLSAATAAPQSQCPPPPAPRRPSKSPARAVPANIAAAGSIVAAQRASDDAKRATIKVESMIRKRSFDAIAAAATTTLPSSSSSSSISRRTNAALPPSPPPSSSPAVETKRRSAARRPAPPPPSTSQGNGRVWGFVNYTFADAHELLTGVAATGPKLGNAANKRRRDDDDEVEEEKSAGKKGKKGRH